MESYTSQYKEILQSCPTMLQREQWCDGVWQDTSSTLLDSKGILGSKIKALTSNMMCLGAHDLENNFQSWARCSNQHTLSSAIPSEAVHMIQFTCFVESLQVEIGPRGCSDSTFSGEACQLRTCTGSPNISSALRKLCSMNGSSSAPGQWNRCHYQVVKTLHQILQSMLSKQDAD